MNINDTTEKMKEENDYLSLKLYKHLDKLQESIDNAKYNLSEMGVLGEKIDNISKGQNEIKTELKEIKEQTQETTGRVTKLETRQDDILKWFPRYTGTVVFFVCMVLSLATYIYVQDQKRLPEQITSIIREELQAIEFDI